MNKKKAMAFLLVSVMAGSMLAGCGSDASSAQGSSSKSAESSNNDSYTVKILAPGDASTDDCAKISEAASKITEEKFNTKTINEQIQNIAQKKDTLCRRMYN